MIAYNAGEIRNAVLTDGIIRAGASIAESDDNAVFFVSDVWASTTDIVVKDAAGTTLISGIGSQSFYVPLKLRGGFTITGTDLSIRFIRVTAQDS